MTATATLTNSCSAVGTINIVNNTKFFESSTSTAWTTAANWKPGNTVPDADKCVVIKTPVVINADTNALARNIKIEKNGATGKLTINGSLTVTDGITNTGLAEDFIVKSDANLKQINEDPNLNTTPISVRRLFTWSDDLRKEYNYLASPVKGQNMKTLFGVTTNTPFALVLRESTNTFVNAAAADYEQPGKGFAVKEPAKSLGGGGDIADIEGEFKGVPNNGTFTTPITKTMASRGWNLIGNPYPSNLDLHEFYQNNSTKILPEFRFWDNRMNNTYVQYGGAYQGYSYAIYNAASDEGNPAPGGDPGNNSSDPTPTADVGGLYRYAKVGQGFVVRANASTYPSTLHLEYKNTQRTSMQPDRGFFGRNDIQKDRYRLQLITPDALTLTQTILYIPNGLNSVGLEDSKHPSTNASDAFYSMEETSKLLINAKAPFQITDKVPLGNNHFIAGVYKIRAVNRLGIFANGQAIYLKDKQLNVITDLTQSDYTFTSEAGEFTNRFEIVYENGSVLATDATTKASWEVYRDAADFVIRSSDKSIEMMQLYDASGRLILSQKGNGKELRFPATGLAEGMYIVKIRLKDGQEFTKKIRK